MKKAYKYRANIIIDGEKRDSIMLSKNALYAAPIDKLNDPFEGSVEFPKSQADEYWVTPLIQQLYKSGIYSLSQPNDNESFPNNELLWAHYANSHKGFCIEYDLDKLLSVHQNFDIKDTINIIYQSERPEITKNNSIHQVREKLFGTKSLSWQYENEIRLVFAEAGEKQIASNAVIAIYFGLNINYEDRHDILNCLSGKNIDFYQMERIGNTYKLQANKLLFDFSYKVIKKERRPLEDNYMILYTSPNKDKNTMIDFISNFRRDLTRPSNITVVDDERAIPILVNYKPMSQMSEYEIKMQAEHWIAYSTFDAPETVWMYPER